MPKLQLPEQTGRDLPSYPGQVGGERYGLGMRLEETYPRTQAMWEERDVAWVRGWKRPTLVPRPRGRREIWPGYEAGRGLPPYPGHVRGERQGLGTRLEETYPRTQAMWEERDMAWVRGWKRPCSRPGKLDLLVHISAHFI